MADEQIYLHLSYICRISNLDSGKVGCGLAAVKTFRSNLISAAEVEADLKNASWPSSGQRLLYRVIDFELDDMLDDSGVAGGGVHDPSPFSRCVKMAGRQADPSDQTPNSPNTEAYAALCARLIKLRLACKSHGSVHPLLVGCGCPGQRPTSWRH